MSIFLTAKCVLVIKEWYLRQLVNDSLYSLFWIDATLLRLVKLSRITISILI